MATFHDLLRELADAHDREVKSIRREIDRSRQAIALRLPMCPSESEDLDEETKRLNAMSAHTSRRSYDRSKTMSHESVDSEGNESRLPADITVSVRAIVHDLTDLERKGSAPTGKFSSGGSSRQMVGNIMLRQEERSASEKWVAGPMETIMGCLIMLNVILTLIQLQVRGLELGAGLEAHTDNSSQENQSTADKVFFALEHVFNAMFVVEILVRISVLRMKVFRDEILKKVQWFNLVDLIVVIFCSVDLYLTPLISSGSSPFNLMFARMLRLARLARTLKVIQVLRAFSKLRILLKTVAASVLSFAWSMMLLGAMNMGGAIFLCQLLQPSIADENMDRELRLWLYRMYGTSSRAMWTMFEFTFSGGWPTYARPVIESVHWAYSIFFALYVSIVVFAVIRIVTALFLKETLTVATKDADFMVHESMKNKQEYTAKLKELFNVADMTGNGRLEFEEFDAICSIPEVLHYFQILELEISEAHAVFDLLDDGDGSITYDNFVKGIFRLKGTARSMDVLSLMRDCQAIERRCERLEDMMSDANRGS